MFEALKWQLSLRSNANFEDWVKDNYTAQGLEQAVKEVTAGDLLGSFDPLGNVTMDQYVEAEDLRRKAVKSLYSRCGGDIWSACLATYERGRDSSAFSCFSRLDLANQIFGPKQFEEFMLRNALKHAARQTLTACSGRSRVT